MIDQRPVREPPALSGELKGHVVGAVEKRGNRHRPQRHLPSACQPEADNEKDEQRRQRVKPLS